MLGITLLILLPEQQIKGVPTGKVFTLRNQTDFKP